MAGVERPLPIGYGATNSQPWTVRFMLELLAVPAGGKLLDVGSGSGWTTALLAHLTGPEGSVLGVDIVPELVSTALAATVVPVRTARQPGASHRCKTAATSSLG